MIIKPGNKSDTVLILTAILFLLLFVRNIYILEFEKVIPLFSNHDHFVLDFEYFYKMGIQSITSPARLYCDPDNEGTAVLLLKRNVFHPYPPPAALLFRMFSILPFAYSYAVWSMLIYIVIVITFYLYVNCLHEERFQGESGMWFPLVLCISAAPAFLDSSFGNVNSLLLLLCVVYAWLFKGKKYVRAGVVLSFAFWLKLYPAVLLLTIFKTGEKRKLIGSFMAGISGVFIISLFFIPIEVFKEFFLEITPAYSGQTITHVFNQSLTPALLRLFRGSTDIFFSYDHMVIPLEFRIVTYVVIVSALIVFWYITLKYKASSTCIIAGLCNLIPLITPIGWGYTFVMLYPSLIILYYRGILRTNVTALLYLLCCFALAAPSYHNIEKLSLHYLFKLIYYSRYTISSLLLYCLLLIQVSKNSIVEVCGTPEDKNTPNSCSGQLPVYHP